MYARFPIWTRVYIGFFGLNHVYTQLCIDTVTYTLIFQDFFNSFCFRRFVCWFECFLRSQVLLSVFRFAASLWFQILSCCGKFWSCFVLLQVSSFVFEHMRFLSQNLGCPGLPEQKDWFKYLWQTLSLWSYFSMLKLHLAAISFSHFLKVVDWQFSKLSFLVFWLLSPSFFLLLFGCSGHLETPILLSSHQFGVDNLQSVLLPIFRSQSLQ